MSEERTSSDLIETLVELAQGCGGVSPTEINRIRATLLSRIAGPLADIEAERRRQVEAEGWTLQHDDDHDNDELADAAACYAVGRNIEQHRISHHAENGIGMWPWDLEWWKPRDRRSNLVRAGALIVAEIERLDRM